MIVQVKPLAEITQEALRILCETMGIVDTVRFLNQLTVGFGNYTEERDQLFAGLTVDDIVSQMEQKRAQRQ